MKMSNKYYALKKQQIKIVAILTCCVPFRGNDHISWLGFRSEKMHFSFFFLFS